MSEHVVKVIVRIPLKCFQGQTRTEVWNVVKDLLGGPASCSSFDEYDGEVEWFEYPHRRFIDNDGKWFLDYLMMRSEFAKFDSYAMPIGQFQAIIETECKRFLADPASANVVFVGWYTGVDEPFEFIESAN
jgi:hypothetical protein